MFNRRQGFTLIELVIVIAIIGSLSAIAFAGFIQIRRMANEKTSGASMRSFLTAEEIFKGSDMDRNGVNDYWTYDITGLIAMTPTGGGKPIFAVSDYAIAYADLDPMAAGTYDNGNFMHPGPFANKQPKAGYWFQSMLLDFSGIPYAQDTDSTNVDCHNHTRWGFCSIPSSYGVTGVFIFILSEDASLFKRDFGSSTPAIPVPAARVPFPDIDQWPDSATLSANWAKVE